MQDERFPCEPLLLVPKCDQFFFFWLASNQFNFFKCIFKCFCQQLHTMASSHFFPLQCSISSSEEERLTSTRRPKTPTSSDCSDFHTQTNWTKSLPLPTPEEKMRQQAQTVQADMVPINITGMPYSVDRFHVFWENDCGSLFGICS